MFGRKLGPSLLLAVALTATAAFAGEGDLFIYDEAVTKQVDVESFVKTGKVAPLNGSGEFCESGGGPAPESYPRIHIWEPGYEQLGASESDADGIWFITAGRYWKKNRMALVLWKVRVPDASSRKTSEYGEDMTLSLWVDWNQNETWD